jgi:hypothetical protein
MRRREETRALHRLLDVDLEKGPDLKTKGE